MLIPIADNITEERSMNYELDRSAVVDFYIVT